MKTCRLQKLADCGKAPS